MSQDQFHWLVVRSNADLVKQSRDVFESGATTPDRGGTFKVAWIIQRYIDAVDGTPGVHRAPSVSTTSSEGLHFDISAQAFTTSADALAWAASEAGKVFLQNRQDAVIISTRGIS